MYKILIMSLFIFSASFANDSLLQTKKRDVEFAELKASLDLNSEDVVLKYKSGTSSVGLKIYQEGDYTAFWMPSKNGSAKAEGQVVTYYLGRFLNMSKLVAPSAYYNVGGEALETFKAMLEEDQAVPPEVSKWKVVNRDNVLAEAIAHIDAGTSQFGSLTVKKRKFKADNLVDWRNNETKREHPLFKFIRAGEEAPSKDTVFDLEEFYPREGEVNTATERQLAKDLSKIMVLDMLTGQWDRFSGGNIEARFDKSKENPLIGRLRFYVRDNGGSAMDYRDTTHEEFTKYLSVVTRFDKKQVERLKLLDALLDSNPNLVKETLRMMSDTSLLSERLKATLIHIEEQVALYGEDKAYF